MRKILLISAVIIVLSLFLCESAAAQQPSSTCSPSGNRLKVGLVLGGGGAKGAAEVGALKVIERLGIPIDYIAGTSIGSIVGALYSVGYRAEALDSLFTNQEWLSLLTSRSDAHSDTPISQQDGVTYIFGFPVLTSGKKPTEGTLGVLSGDRIVEMLQQMTHQADSINFDSLPIPFRCVATDIKRQQTVVLSSGNLPMSIRASMAIPGMFTPVFINGKELVDGGMLNNLPVDVVKAMGADIILAIDLTQKKHKTRDFSLSETLGIGGLLDWVVSRPDWRIYNNNRKMADLIINPKLEAYGTTSFSREAITHMMRQGERAAEEMKDSLIAFRRRVFEGK